MVAGLPESPVWLKSKKRVEKAEKAAKWLYLHNFEATEVQQHNEQLMKNKI